MVISYSVRFQKSYFVEVYLVITDFCLFYYSMRDFLFNPASYVETEVHYVAVLNYIVLTLDGNFSQFAAFGLGT